MEILHTKGLEFTYPMDDKKVLKSVDISFEQGLWYVLCGRSGSGKTTLLKHLKPSLEPNGLRSGEVVYKGKSFSDYNQRTLVEDIGYVSQNPDHQVVTDKVYHELAFAMESLGYDTDIIRIRIAEMASFFGISNWFYDDVQTLSGGQKQLLNLAAVMTLNPKVLILDEPLSQLDPIASADFLAMLKKINDDLGVTIIMSEHRLDTVIPYCDQLVVMDSGKVMVDDTPQKVGLQLKLKDHEMFEALTSPMRIYLNIFKDEKSPVTIKEGRRWLESAIHHKTLEKSQILTSTETIIDCKNLWFRYNKDAKDIIRDLSFSLNKGDFYALVGSNGSGKSTLTRLISKMSKPYRGKIKADKNLNVLMLPQDPTILFSKKEVGEEASMDYLRLMGLDHLEKRHPFDLSGGEAQKLSLAKVLEQKPDLLILDEPTKGLDAYFKKQLADLLLKLRHDGVTILMVSHDIEFCAKYTNRCGLFFDGRVITENRTRDFFVNNNFYTTAANRMIGHMVDVVTDEDVIEICKIN